MGSKINNLQKSGLFGLGGFLANKAGMNLWNEGSPGGYDVVQMPQYSFTEPRNRLVSDYLSQNIERMGRGEYPVWYDKARPVMREGMQRGLDTSMYGRPGDRGMGAFNAVSQAGAMGGVGPKALMSQTRKLSNDYMDKSKAIDEYLTSLGVNIMQSSEGNYLNASNSMMSGPPSQIVNRQGTASGLTGLGQLGLTAAGYAMGGPMGGAMAGGIGQQMGQQAQPTYSSQLYGANSPMLASGYGVNQGFNQAMGGMGYQSMPWR